MLRTTGLVMAAYLLAGPAEVPAEGADAPARHTYVDSEIARKVQHDLEGLGLGDVRVDVIAGEVTLRGAAPSLGAVRKAVERAEKIHDVQAVDPEMRVEETSDPEIRAGIEEKLGRDVHYTLYDHVTTSVEGGRVELSGEVTMPDKIAEIESAVADVPGVRKIDNHIRVLASSPSDESLRIAVAVGIYDRFPQYAMSPAPPVHVVVEKGRVTLFGTVGDPAEDRTVEQIARQTPGALSVEDRLAIASLQEERRSMRLVAEDPTVLVDRLQAYRHPKIDEPKWVLCVETEGPKG